MNKWQISMERPSLLTLTIRRRYLSSRLIFATGAQSMSILTTTKTTDKYGEVYRNWMEKEWITFRITISNSLTAIFIRVEIQYAVDMCYLFSSKPFSTLSWKSRQNLSSTPSQSRWKSLIRTQWATLVPSHT